MAVEDSVAQDQLRAFIERIERLEEEKAGIASDIKEIYAEAKGNGFDTKILRKIVAIRKQDANERMEQDAILELYMGALGMVAAPTADYDDEPVRNTGPMANSAARLDAWAEQVADRIDPQLLLTIIEASKTEIGRKLVMSAIEAVKNGDVVSTAHIENIEPQPTKAAGSDLAASPALSGQVADIPDIGTPISIEIHERASTDDEASSEAGPQAEASLAGYRSEMLADREARHEGQAASADLPTHSDIAIPISSEPSASIYPAPGEVYWENTPRKPVHRHEYSVAFGDLGQDHCVITEDISKAQAAPIVMIGDTILDGWARYNCALCTVGLDGQTAYYPAVQYDGTDPLIDCIRWNMEGRILNESQRRLIAKRLVAIEPKRKADIFKALDMGMELVA